MKKKCPLSKNALDACAKTTLLTFSLYIFNRIYEGNSMCKVRQYKII